MTVYEPPALRKLVNVYVPRGGKLEFIDAASGIVGTLDREGTLAGELLLDYEGNRYGYSNVRTYADRVHKAWDRHSTRYPTIARMRVHRDSVVQVGVYDPEAGVVTLIGPKVTLAAWLGVEKVDPAQLRTTMVPR